MVTHAAPAPVHKPLAAVVIEPLAVKIPEAAAIVGISRSQFYKDYLDPGLVTPIPNGSTGVLIDVAQLREAYGKRVAALMAKAQAQ